MSKPNPNSKPWYEIVNAASGQAEMLLYGFIGPYDAIDDKAFVRDFGALASKNKEITLRLNSGGGSVFAGIPIYNALVASTATVNIVVEGMAASMASILLQGASAGRRRMYKNARVMVHKPSGGAFGSAKKMRDSANLMDSLEETLADIYVEKTGQDADTVKGWLIEGVDRWFTAKEALAAGLIDEIVDATPVPVTAPKNSTEEDMYAIYHAALSQNAASQPNDSLTQTPPLLMKYGLIQAAVAAHGITAALSETSSETDIVDVINRVAKAKDAKIAELQNQLNASNEEKVTTLVNEAVSSGKIVSSQKDQFEKLARADYASTAAILGGMAPKASASGVIQPDASTDKQEGKDADPRAGWDFARYRKEAPGALAKMQQEDPKLYEALKDKYTKTLNTK
jgi:ATP-dependent Clp endopeptidase proteolytic subunit ClpP